MRDATSHPDAVADQHSPVTAPQSADPAAAVPAASAALPGAVPTASPNPEEAKQQKAQSRRPSVALSDVVVEGYVNEVAKEIPVYKLRWDPDCSLGQMGQRRVLDQDKVTRREASPKITPPVDLIPVTVWAMDVVGVLPNRPGENFLPSRTCDLFSLAVTLRTCALAWSAHAPVLHRRTVWSAPPSSIAVHRRSGTSYRPVYPPSHPPSVPRVERRRATFLLGILFCSNPRESIHTGSWRLRPNRETECCHGVACPFVGIRKAHVRDVLRARWFFFFRP